MPDWSAISERLRRMAQALTRGRDDADDLVQQTLVTLLAKRPDRAGHIGYARQTMTRIWLDRQRSLRRRVRRMARWAMTAGMWHTDQDRLSLSDQHDRVRRAMDALPPRQRAAVVLRLVEELDYDDIAAALGCSVQSVRTSLHLGRQRVRRLVGEAS
jgi:RNA polymerase sigma factor (sigma-70 family)